LQRRFLSLAFVASIVAVCFVACSGEGEGQRCSTTDDPGGPANNPEPNGSSDCSGNNICYPVSALGSAAQNYSVAYDPALGICCPVIRTANDPVEICALSPSPPGGDAAPPADAGTGEAASQSDGAPANDAGDAGVAASDAGDAGDAGTDAAAIADAAAE
jgi:hypothetical protein